MKPLTPIIPKAQASSFAEDFEAAMQGLRGALTELLASLGEDPRVPQEVSRHHGINKNLAWKICKIINSTDVYASAQNVPGLGGMRIFLRAFEKGGAPAEALSEVEMAMERFEAMVRVHVGDRANLELYLGSIQPEGIHSTQLEVSRRMSFLGNSALWGVQARVNLSVRLIAPNADDPSRADLCSVGGLLGFRRLRPTASWPVLQEQLYSSDLEVGARSSEPIDPSCAEGGPPLVREFCSSPLPATRTHVNGEKTTHEIREGQVGNTAAIDCVFGVVERAMVPIHADDQEAVGEHYCRAKTPVEMVQFDLLVHRDLPFEMPPKLVTYSLLHGDFHFPLSRAERCHIPGTATVQDLGAHPPIIASPHIPRYAKLIDLACERLGHPLTEFHGYRMTLSYPPIPTTFVMHHPLPAVEKA